MYRLTPKHRLQIVQIYFEKHGSTKETRRALRAFYGAHNRPSFGVMIIHKPLSKHHYIQRKSPFGALYGLVESLVYIPSNICLKLTVFFIRKY